MSITSGTYLHDVDRYHRLLAGNARAKLGRVGVANGNLHETDRGEGKNGGNPDRVVAVLGHQIRHDNEGKVQGVEDDEHVVLFNLDSTQQVRVLGFRILQNMNVHSNRKDTHHDVRARVSIGL